MKYCGVLQLDDVIPWCLTAGVSLARAVSSHPDLGVPTRVVSGRHFGIKFDSCLEPFWVTLPGSFEATPGGRIEQGLVELVGTFLAPGRRTRLFLVCGQEGSLASIFETSI